MASFEMERGMADAPTKESGQATIYLWWMIPPSQQKQSVTFRPVGIALGRPE